MTTNARLTKAELLAKLAELEADRAPEAAPQAEPSPPEPTAAELAEQYNALSRAEKRAVDKAAAEEGFVAPRKVFRLTFEGTDLKGLVVRARGLSIGRTLEMVGLASMVEVGTEELDPEQMKAISELFDGFAEALIEWNLRAPVLDSHGEPTGDSIPVPPTSAGMMGEDLDTVMPVVMKWIEAVVGVAAPLASASNSGATLPGGSMPMETKSPSPQNSPEQN